MAHKHQSRKRRAGQGLFQKQMKQYDIEHHRRQNNQPQGQEHSAQDHKPADHLCKFQKLEQISGRNQRAKEFGRGFVHGRGIHKRLRQQAVQTEDRKRAAQNDACDDREDFDVPTFLETTEA